jgi:hypothetical protein
MRNLAFGEPAAPSICATCRLWDLRRAGRSRPVHELADKSRLVPRGNRIDESLFRKDGPDHDVRLDIHHDDVFVMFDARDRVTRPRERMSSSLDDTLDLFASRHRLKVVRDKSRSVLDRFACAASVVATVRPADALEGLTRLADVEIDDHGHMQPLGPRYLREDHGPEFAGSDQRRSHRTSLGRAARKQCGNIHVSRVPCAAAILPA